VHLQNLLGDLTSWKMGNGAPMQEDDLKALRNAVEALEHPGGLLVSATSSESRSR